MIERKNELLAKLPDELRKFVLEDDAVHTIEYPIEVHPTTVKSMKLDKVPLFEKKLVGIKGQYLIFDDNTVMNVRSHEGYHISLSI